MRWEFIKLLSAILLNGLLVVDVHFGVRVHRQNNASDGRVNLRGFESRFKVLDDVFLVNLWEENQILNSLCSGGHALLKVINQKRSRRGVV